MKLPRALVIASVLAATSLSTHAAQFKFTGHTITVPDGFEVELVAGPPLVDRPITADFDEQGRLYVSDSSGSNDKVEKQLGEKPHRILRLEDIDGDGRFDRSSVFADKMMFPEGTMWFDGSVYVAAPPSIWKLTDTDGDGVADRGAEWFQGKTLTGCANDLHGPYLGPDGWIYWCKGAFAKQTHERPGRKPFVTRAAHIFRARPDGTGLEPVMTGGMDNPVDVVFTPGGERIFTTTFFQHPGGGQRDGLIHAVYGGVYGKVHDVIDEHPRTGDIMPVLTHMGPAAPCGLVRYESRAFGEEYADNLFACQFNLHKVSRHVLVPDGATFKTRDSDFLVSDNTDFHPTDVIEDADGSLLVVDTGGWYKLCCPTSQLPKPDVLGAIYRVRRKGAPLNDPRGLKLDWAGADAATLAKRLDDERSAVRNRAMHQLGRLGASAVPALHETVRRGGSVAARRNAVWALTRIDGEAARAAVRVALDDRDESVVSAALHSVALHRDTEAFLPLSGVLGKPSLHLQRNAATALGRLGLKPAVPNLLSRATVPPDRVFEHALIYALIEIGDKEGTTAGLSLTNAFIRRVALIALDQMEGGGLKPEQVTPLLASSDSVLKQTAQWIVGRHSDWGEALAGYFGERLGAGKLTEAEGAELQGQLAQLARSPSVQDLLAKTLRDLNAPKHARLLALRAMARSGLKEPPASWLAELARAVASEDVELAREAVAAARGLPLPKKGAGELIAALQRAGRTVSLPVETRLEALAAVPGGLTEVEPALLDFLREHTAPEKPVLVRSAAAGVLGSAHLDTPQLFALAETVKTAGPLEIGKLLAPFERSTNAAVGARLLAALRESKGRAGLRPEVVRPRLTNFPHTVQRSGEELLAQLNADAAKQQARLEELTAALKDGDVRRGQALFNNNKTACSSCHAIGYLGGNLGPDLTRIGQVRTERDLLEAIVFPSASFVRSYEPIVVVTKAGEEHSGVLRKDAPDEVVLGTGPGAEMRIARADVAEVRPGTMSVMPAGLDEQLSRQELADLLAFLKATRWGARE